MHYNCRYHQLSSDKQSLLMFTFSQGRINVVQRSVSYNISVGLTASEAQTGMIQQNT